MLQNLDQIVIADRIANIMMNGLKATMEKKGRQATGNSVRLLTWEYHEEENMISIMGQSHWKYIERGRPANQTPPPLDRIMEWCVAKGIPKQLAYPIRANIAKFGSPRTKPGSDTIDQKKLGVAKDTMELIMPDIEKEMDKQLGSWFDLSINSLWAQEVK